MQRLQPETQIRILFVGGLLWFALFGLWTLALTRMWIVEMPLPAKVAFVPLSVVCVYCMPIGLGWLGFRFLLSERHYARRHLGQCGLTIGLVVCVMIVYLTVVIYRTFI